VDLEPPGTGGVEFAAGSVTAVSQIGDHWAGVVWPAAEISTPPIELHSSTRVDVESSCGTACAGTAVESGVVGTPVGVGAGDLADSGASASIAKRSVSDVGLTVDADGRHESVGGNVGGEEQGDEDES